MRILGLADGRDASAALVIDGVLVGRRTTSSVTGAEDDRGVPWAAADAVLDEAGLRRDDVNHVAFAGRFTPWLPVRRHPKLRTLARGPFSPAHDLHAMVLTALRSSGLGASEADRAREWAKALLVEHGYAPDRVQMIGVHKALASAAYRTQDVDEVLVVSAHPMGDGVAVAVHHCEAGRVERVWEQRSLSALHVHLQRCTAALGLARATSTETLTALAGGGRPSPALRDLLTPWLAARGPRLVGHRLSVLSRERAAVYAALSAAPPPVAAASLVDNLKTAAQALVAYHVRAEGLGHVLLAGALLQDPRVVASVAEVPGVTAVTPSVFGGFGALAVGAAASAGGIAPRRPAPVGLGSTVDVDAATAALHTAGVRPVRRRNLAKWASDRLAKGHGVMRLSDRGGLGRWGSGRAAVFVAANDTGAVARLRAALGRPQAEEPGCIVTSVEAAAAMPASLSQGSSLGGAASPVTEAFAQSCPGVVSADGRARLVVAEATGDPWLTEVLARLAGFGISALACFPLSSVHDLRAIDAAEAVARWRHVGLDALVLGPFGVSKGTP